MEAFIPKTSYPNVIKIVRSMQPSLYFYMKERRSMWPKNFDELGAIECNIGLYIFPEFSRLLFTRIDFGIVVNLDL